MLFIKRSLGLLINLLLLLDKMIDPIFPISSGHLGFCAKFRSILPLDKIFMVKYEEKKLII